MPIIDTPSLTQAFTPAASMEASYAIAAQMDDPLDMVLAGGLEALHSGSPASFGMGRRK